MKWLDDSQCCIAFNQLLLNARPDVDALMKTMVKHLEPTETAAIFLTAAKFVVIYGEQRTWNPDEDIALAFHISLNRLMEEPSTRSLMNKLMAKGVNSTYGVDV